MADIEITGLTQSLQQAGDLDVSIRGGNLILSRKAPNGEKTDLDAGSITELRNWSPKVLADYVAGVITGLSLGTAAQANTGTGANQVPKNSDLGAAAYLGTGTGANQVPKNSDLGAAAYLETGTGANQVPKNSDLGAAAYLGVGAGATQLPRNSDLGTIPKVINFTSATGAVEITDTLPGMAIGDRVLVRKLNATQGTVTITCTGHTFTRATLASVALNSDGDFWLIEKVSATRLDLVDGFSSGDGGSGNWRKNADLSATVFDIRTDTASIYVSGTYGSTSGDSVAIPDSFIYFPFTFKSPPFVNVNLSTTGYDTNARASNISTTTYVIRCSSRTPGVKLFNVKIFGEWA